MGAIKGGSESINESQKSVHRGDHFRDIYGDNSVQFGESETADQVSRAGQKCIDDGLRAEIVIVSFCLSIILTLVPSSKEVGFPVKKNILRCPTSSVLSTKWSSTKRRKGNNSSWSPKISKLYPKCKIRFD